MAPLHSGDGLIIHLPLILSMQSTSAWSSNKRYELGFNTQKENTFCDCPHRDFILTLQKPPCQVTQHCANLLLKSGGNYLLPPQGEGWCCLYTGIPGRPGKQDMKIHSFLQYHPHCLPMKNENAHTWRKKNMSGPSFWARADNYKKHVPVGLKGKTNEKREKKHHTWHSPSCTPSCPYLGPLLPLLASFQTTINSTRLPIHTCCAGATSAVTLCSLA